ncbi:YciI family protein [Rhizocola hellebori]|nr:YciI family protein [Rhizocola hellebori]
MSEYLILIYEAESAYATASEQVMGEVMEAHNAFSEKFGSAIKGGHALQPTLTATSIRDAEVTDGAFAETKEALGGYYLVEAADFDEAIAIAKEVPARFGGVEVRPVMVFEE